jgi:hypothetical protein
VTIKKLLRIEDTPKREPADVPMKAHVGFIQSAGGAKMTDGDFVRQFGTTDELAGLRRLIEERRQNRPAFTYWLCPKCGWRAKLGPDSRQPLACLRCNLAQYKDSGWLRRMSASEAKAFEADVKASETKAIERLKRAHFHEVNENRRRAGLEPQTRAEFDADSRRAARRQIERSQARP